MSGVCTPQIAPAWPIHARCSPSLCRRSSSSGAEMCSWWPVGLLELSSPGINWPRHWTEGEGKPSGRDRALGGALRQSDQDISKQTTVKATVLVEVGVKRRERNLSALWAKFIHDYHVQKYRGLSQRSFSYGQQRAAAGHWEHSPQGTLRSTLLPSSCVLPVLHSPFSILQGTHRKTQTPQTPSRRNTTLFRFDPSEGSMATCTVPLAMAVLPVRTSNRCLWSSAARGACS